MTYPAAVQRAPAQVNHLRAIQVINRQTLERLTVELEIGQKLWLRDDNDLVQIATRAQLPAERWEIIESVDTDCWGGDQVRGAA